MGDDYSLNLFRGSKLNRRRKGRKSKKKRKCKKRKKCKRKGRRSKRRRSKKKKRKKGKPAWRNKIVRPKLVDERVLVEPEKPIIDNRMNHHAFQQQTLSHQNRMKSVMKGKGRAKEKEREREKISDQGNLVQRAGPKGWLCLVNFKGPSNSTLPPCPPKG